MDTGLSGVARNDLEQRITYYLEKTSLTEHQNKKMRQLDVYKRQVVCGFIASMLAAVVSMLVAAKMHTISVAVCIPFFFSCVMVQKKC